MNVITNELLQVSSNCYYLALQKNRNIWGLAWWFFGHQKQYKNRNPNDYITRKSIKTAERCQI